MKIKLPFKINISRIFENKKITITLALLLSFAIWLSVMINQNPVREQVFTDITASISIDNTAASDMGLGIVSDISSQKFTVTLSGPNYVISSISSDDFILTADVSGINSAGTQTLTVYGNRNSSKSGYTFKSISPADISVTFDYIDSSEYTLVPKLVGVSAADGLVAETPVVANSEQSTLTVKGPRSTVSQIASVGSYCEVNKTLSSSQTFDSYVVLYDENGETLFKYIPDGSVVDKDGNRVANNYLSLSFTTVKVTQPISKKVTLPVKATFNNMPSGLSQSDISYKIDHNFVTVIGTPDVVSELDYVSLSPIDFANITSQTSKFEMTASLKDGVRLLDTIEYFTVTIDTSGYTEKVFNVSNIKCIGLGSGLTVSNDGVIKNVKISGPKEIISEIKATDLYAVADLADKSTGSHTVTAVIKSDKYNKFWQVGSYSIAVTIK